MIEVVDGRRSEGPTDDADIQRWEGWILGQSKETTSTMLPAISTTASNVVQTRGLPMPVDTDPEDVAYDDVHFGGIKLTRISVRFENRGGRTIMTPTVWVVSDQDQDVRVFGSLGTQEDGVPGAPFWFDLSQVPVKPGPPTHVSTVEPPTSPTLNKWPKTLMLGVTKVRRYELKPAKEKPRS